MRPNFVNLLFAAAVLVLATACFCRSDRKSTGDSGESPQSPANGGSQTNSPAREAGETLTRKSDAGDFLVAHLPVSNVRYDEIDRQVRDEKLLEKAADKLNRALSLPRDLYLKTKDCGEANAFYNADDQSVTVCYELMEHFFVTFKTAGDSDEKAYAKMFDAAQFVFLHEIGHALIDLYQLPITGSEEDAADRCSSFINITELGDGGVRSVLTAADVFALESKQGTRSSRRFADEHLQSEQRFYNSLCMIYGSNQQKYEYLVSGNYLPPERAARCPNEYQKTTESWTKLLAEWRRS